MIAYTRQEERAPLSLQIDDAQGSQVFALDDAGPLVADVDTCGAAERAGL